MDCLSENYQLKWHSFGSYLHNSVASSICGGNDTSSFTDVVLLTIDGHQLLAHRFILSACSQYLNEILKSHCKMTTTLPLLIVLPPEINYKTLKILMQYMYSGEATVSKDILENVLRGGDLLKVKGLWRPREDEQNDKKLVKVHNEKKRNPLPEKRIQQKPVENKRPERPFSVLKSTKSAEENLPQSSNTHSNNNKNHTEQVDQTYKSKSKPENHNEKDNRITFSSAASTSSTSVISSQDCPNEETNIAEQLLVIKQEPIEWIDHEEDMQNCENFDEQITIKAEVLIDDDKVDSKDDDLSNGDDNEQIYSPLTCELCAETFTLPAEWVRHIQTHTDMMPAKRQRRGKSSMDEDTVSGGNFPPLHCDMCQKYYSTPAEWVHHIQNTHTEFELRLSNKNNTSPKARASPLIKTISSKSPQLHGNTPKICAVCNKKFPSHASMLIHKRTHTGERPYTCRFCCKGFNVKSNLLRHLRTLHDKIINSAEVDPRDEVNVADNV